MTGNTNEAAWAEEPVAEDAEALPAEGASEDEGALPGTSEFLWVAALSLANAVLRLLGLDVSLIFGLSSTMIASYVFAEYVMTYVAISVAIIAVFGVIGWGARKGWAWAFIVGIALYLLDAGAALWAVLVVGDTSFGLDLLAHAAVLFLVVRAFIGMRRARA